MYRSHMRFLHVVPVTVLTIAAATPLCAQEFVPPDRRPAPPSQAPAQQTAAPQSGFFVDVLGFSTRGGAQVNKGGQFVVGSTIDIAQLGSPQVRLRPSLETGFGSASTSVGVNVEVMYRFQPDAAPAIPYLGIGFGYYDDNTIKKGWPTVTMGFELPFKRTMNWLIEYHALDTLKRSRFFVGLATRGS